MLENAPFSPFLTLLSPSPCPLTPTSQVHPWGQGDCSIDKCFMVLEIIHRCFKIDIFCYLGKTTSFDAWMQLEISFFYHNELFSIYIWRALWNINKITFSCPILCMWQYVHNFIGGYDVFTVHRVGMHTCMELVPPIFVFLYTQRSIMPSLARIF